MSPPEETLPDPAPFPTFFLPNFFGVLFALLTEKIDLEERLSSVLLSEEAHPYALLGLGIFAIANANSYLGGTVVLSRIECNVKLPNLYASKTHNKNAVLFNCVQRGHQNFLENYPQLVLSVLFTAIVADRPNVAGLILLIVAVCRILYAILYRNDIKSRIGPFLIALFATNIGVGYGALIGLSGIGIKLLRD